MTEPAAAAVELTPRVLELHREVRRTKPALCAERARLVTRYFRQSARRGEPVILQKAEGLAAVLEHKRVHIHPRELLVGCFTAHRVGGGLLPELHGVAMLEDLLAFDRRRVNPLQVSRRERWQLLTEVLPYWASRFLAMQIQPRKQALRFVATQLDGSRYIVNEAGGISHVVPNYQGLIEQGTDGYRARAARLRQGVAAGSAEDDFLRAVTVVCDGLDAFADGYRRRAEQLARQEQDAERRGELERIAAVCARVPKRPARTLHEALQALLFAQIAINLESLDNSVCPGRLDQILYPHYRRDLEAGTLTAAGALELLGCFAVKLCEIVPAFSRRLTEIHGGLFNGQVVVVGGTDRSGRDATNELSLLWLRLMDGLRTRQPNYHARLHAGSPPAYRRGIARALAGGSVSPALYNDEVIVPVLRDRGIALEDARDYATVGCVEPVAAGKSFLSTDAALVNVPSCLEQALNGGRRFGGRRRIGAATPPAERVGTMEELVQLFRLQLEHTVRLVLADLRLIERANAEHHPTPLTSMLLEGCLERALDSTRGGARYNGSGVQCVGTVDVGDSFAAIDDVVFRRQQASLGELIEACRRDFRGAEALRARLRRAPKYGNDDARADGWTARVMELFSQCLAGRVNERGGEYVAGFYSVTAHAAFGRHVGALPSGRRAGRPFSSGLSPASSVERAGPTAALLSAARLPTRLAENGLNFNLELSPGLVAGQEGAGALEGLIAGGFAAGCMQMQVNVLDPQILLEARDHPGRHPGLLVRVSGYSAYFDDLSPEMQQEIIDRTLYGSGDEGHGPSSGDS